MSSTGINELRVRVEKIITTALTCLGSDELHAPVINNELRVRVQVALNYVCAYNQVRVSAV